MFDNLSKNKNNTIRPYALIIVKNMQYRAYLSRIELFCNRAIFNFY